VRFDAFVQEHLLGEKCGYYSTKVDMSKGARPEVYTPNSDPEYSRAVSGTMVRLAVNRSSMMGLRSVVFAEIGGGSGNFKRAFLEQWPTISGERIGLEYVSVEPNPNHRTAQSPDGKAVKGTAQKTGLKAASVDFLFDEEVLDCFPFRLMKFNGKTLQSEAFVLARDGAMLELRYDAVERDELAGMFEMYLSKTNAKPGVVVFSNDYEKYWEESMRVLKPGGSRFSIDYVPMGQLNDDNVTAMRAQHIVRVPYQEDLTHMIDYRLQCVFAGAIGFVNMKVSSLMSLLTGPAQLLAFDRQIMGAVKPEF